MIHLAILMMLACGGQPTPTASETPKTPSAQASKKVKKPGANTAKSGEKVQTVRGTVRFSPEGATLTPCGETQALTVEAGSGNPNQMRKDLGGEPDEVYVEARGTRKDSTFKVRSFDLAIAEDQCDAIFDHTMQATGHDPFWSLTIDPDSLVLARLDQEDLKLKPLSDKTSVKFKHTFTTTTEADEPVTVVLHRKRCSDTASTAYYPWTTSVTLGETTLSGCGRGILPKVTTAATE